MPQTRDMQDQRIRRTQRSLSQALIALTLERGYDAVTIRDITARAGVGYATFFRHYPDKETLLVDVLDVVLDDLTALLQPQTDHGASEAVGVLLFQYVQEHSELCRVLLDSRGSSLLIERMQQSGERSVLQQHTPREASPVPAEIAAHHLVASTIALVQWWLDHNMPYSLERMGNIYRDLIVQPTLDIAFRS